MDGPLSWATLVVATLVAALGASLFAMYVRLYRKVSTWFTFGLATFAALFLAEGVFLAYATWEMLPAVEGPISAYLFGIAVLEAGGLGVQLAVATR